MSTFFLIILHSLSLGTLKYPSAFGQADIRICTPTAAAVAFNLWFIALKEEKVCCSPIREKSTKNANIHQHSQVFGWEGKETLPIAKSLSHARLKIGIEVEFRLVYLSLSLSVEKCHFRQQNNSPDDKKERNFFLGLGRFGLSILEACKEYMKNKYFSGAFYFFPFFFLYPSSFLQSEALVSMMPAQVWVEIGFEGVAGYESG